MGAWIETQKEHEPDEQYHVAPYVGAWIETKHSLSILNFLSSHPMWVRGLKHRA